MPFFSYVLAASLLLGVAVSIGATRIVRRWPEERPLWGEAARCHVCGAPSGVAGWRALVAVRRKTCGHGVDPLALLSGAVIGVGFPLLTVTHPGENLLAWGQGLFLLAILYMVAVIDGRTMLVDTRLVTLGLAVRLALLAGFERDSFMPMAAGMLIAAGFFHILDLFYETLRGRRGLGEGDAAVAALVGAYVGWQGLLPVLGFSAAAGLAGGTAWLLITRRGLAAPFAFAPYLGAAGFAVYVAQLHGWRFAGGVWPF